LLGFVREHVFLGFIEIIPGRVNSFNQSGILNLPLLVILFLEELDLLCVEKLLSILIFEFCTLNEEEGFLETGSSLFSLILELSVESIIDHKTLMNRKLTCHPQEVADTLV
jgi:hypothetical protein